MVLLGITIINQSVTMSQLKKIDQALANAKSVKDALSLDFVRERFIKNYEAVTGHKDGANRFASEVFHYLEITNENQKLKDADKFSHFAALVKAGTTGLSFGKEGQLYPILYGNIVKVQIGAHGKRELIRRMPDVKMITEAQVVLKGDTFKHDKLNNKVAEHISSEKAPTATLDNIIAAYCRIIYKDGNFVDIVVYHDDLVKAKSKSKMQSETSTWNQWPVEMAKKVTYNRAYKLYYRQPQVEVADIKGFDADEDDQEEEVKDIPHQEVKAESKAQPDSRPVEEAKVVTASAEDEDIKNFLGK